MNSTLKDKEAPGTEAKLRRCLVVGGSGSIGGAVCRLLKGLGAEVSFTYNKGADAAEQLKQELDVPAYACDLSDAEATKEAVRKASDEMGGLDALIVTAGASGHERFYKEKPGKNGNGFGSISLQEAGEIVSVNTMGTFAVCQGALEQLKQSGGNIVIVGSMDGVKTVPSPIHFALSKAALKGLTESLSKELGIFNIRVNMIAPGIMEGGQSDLLSEERLEPYLKHCSLKRLGQPEEAAEVITWFALENSYITGQSILLDGGL